MKKNNYSKAFYMMFGNSIRESKELILLGERIIKKRKGKNK